MIPHFDEAFMLFRLRHIIEDEISEGDGGSMDMMAAHNFRVQFKEFKFLIEKSAELHLQFWNYLTDEFPDLVRLSQQGGKINESITLIEELWKTFS